jgi:hypothetical protein
VEIGARYRPAGALSSAISGAGLMLGAIKRGTTSSTPRDNAYLSFGTTLS